MRENKWRKEMPELPKNVHEAVLGALDMIETEKKEEGMIPMRKHRSKRKTLLIAALVAAMLGTTAFAAELIWNSKVTEQFNNPSQEVQQQTMESGVAAIQNASVTDKGVTVTAVQTLQDENRVYLMLKVEAEEAVIDAQATFRGWELHDGEDFDIFDNMGAHWVDESVGELSKDGYYVIDALKWKKKNWNGDHLQVSLSDFVYYEGEKTEHHIDGNWELDLILTDASALSKTIPVKQQITCKGTSVMVNYVKVSPLSVMVSYAEEDVLNMEVAKDDFIIDYLDSIDLVEKDVKEPGDNWRGAASSWGTEEGEYMMMQAVNRILDVEQLDSIILGDGQLVIEVE